LTEKGLRVNAAQAGTVEAAVEAMIAATPAVKLQHARDVLKALARSLDEPRGASRPSTAGPRRARR
jgi:hypothetical protein